MRVLPDTIKCHECFGRGFIVLPRNFASPEVDTKYGVHTIPADWSKLNHVYIWFEALKKQNGEWRGVPGYVYETPSGEYLAPLRGELIKVIKDTRDEFREAKD